MPMYSSVVADDDNIGGTSGNGDHLMNPGETIDLPVYIRNFGNVTEATNVSATMTSDNPQVTIVNATTTYPNLAPGDSATGVTPFRISVGAGLEDRVQVLLTLSIVWSTGQTVGVIPLDCHAGNAIYVRHHLSGALNPGSTSGLTVVVQNAGGAPMSDVTGHLIPMTPYVLANVATVSFGDIPVGATDSNAAVPFTLTASPVAFRGLQAPMRLILTTAAGFADTTQFIVSVGTAEVTDPTGPDAYGYYAFDDADTGYVMHPTFDYVDISGTGQNLNLNDTGEKTSVTPIWSAAQRLPFGFKFYGHVYDTLTICSNGWCAFGDQSWYDGFRNLPIPGMRAPDAMIAPYWDDLITSGTGHGVYVLNDEANHRYIIQWKATAYSGSPNLDFEVMLYDTLYWPTISGNGNILMQYNHVVMNIPSQYYDDSPGCTIGIQAPGNTVGLQYAYITTYSPGADTVRDGRAILFSCDALHGFGQILGTIRDAASNQPIGGAPVTIEGSAYHALSDSAGAYVIPVLAGVYTVRAAPRRYNEATVADVVVPIDSIVTVNFSLTHPQMVLSATSLHDSVGSEPGQTSFTISNPGNGPLDFSTSVYTPGGHTEDPWDSVGTVNVGQLTGDNQVWGCEFLGSNWWVTGSATLDGHGLIYKFDRNGDYRGSIPQPSTALSGWFDMATDGQYLYGSDSHVIYGIDTTGQVVDTIPSPLNPSRALAFDSVTQHFWIADYTSDIYEIDRFGNVVQQIPNAEGLNITGLAWYAADPDNYKLYIFSRDGALQTRVSKLRTITPHTVQTVTDLSAEPGDHAAGCTITSGWNGIMQVFADVVRNANSGARLAIYKLFFNSSWMHVVPSAANVPGGGQQDVTVTFDPEALLDATYHVDLHVSSVIYDTTYVLPVTLIVDRAEAAGKHSPAAPTQFALYPNYPNPFNPTTQIRFDLPKAEYVRLRIYNSLGQLVATLLDDAEPAGAHGVTWDGAHVSTGLYFCRLEAGSFVQTRKMLLMK